MPTIKTETLDSNLIWGVWKIDEQISVLKEMVISDEALEEIMDTAKSERKILETLCSRVLLQNLASNFKINYSGIYKNEFGKPFLIDSNENISITHSFPYVGCSINREVQTGIDVEHFSEKIKRIEHKFLSEQETFDANHEVKKLVTIWAAKEALYKYYGRRSLIFKEDLEITPFEMLNSGSFTGKIKKNNEILMVDLYYYDCIDYVVVVTIG